MIRMGISIVVACVMAFPVIAADNTTHEQVVDAFVESLVKNKDLEDLDRKRALEAVDSLRRDQRARGTEINEGLRLAYPEFGKALAALGDERFEDATQTLDSLMNRKDPFLVAAATMFQARSYAMQHRHDEALGLLQDLAANHQQFTVNMPEVVFLTGSTEAQLLQRKEAIATFQRFLEEYPDAAPRLRNAAIAHLEKLEQIDFSLLDDVHDKMNFSHRQLAKMDSGERTQRVQDDVVALLSELIDEIEKKGGS